MTIRLALTGSRLLFFFVVVIAFSGVFASNGGLGTEKTLAMIKPDGLLGNYTDRIKMAILESGFSILKERIVELDEDRASRFYAEHSLRSFFPNLVKYMTSGPLCIMVLEKQNAIADWCAMIGPTDATKAKATHPNRFSCMISALGQCVDWIQRKIVFMVQILSSQLKERSHFSLKKKLVKWLKNMMNYNQAVLSV